MIIGEYPESLIEAVALHDFLAKLGYSPESEIFLAFYQSYVGVMLKADGKECYLRIGIAELPPNEMKRKWLALVAEWNTNGTMTNVEKDCIYVSSFTFTNKPFILGSLHACGFRARE